MRRVCSNIKQVITKIKAYDHDMYEGIRGVQKCDNVCVFVCQNVYMCASICIVIGGNPGEDRGDMSPPSRKAVSPLNNLRHN